MDSAHLADVAILINVNIDASWTLFTLSAILFVGQRFGDQIQVLLIQRLGLTSIRKVGALKVRIGKYREWFKGLDSFRKVYFLSWISAILSLTAVMVWEISAFFAGWSESSEWVALPLGVWLMWTGVIYLWRGARVAVCRIGRLFA